MSKTPEYSHVYIVLKMIQNFAMFRCGILIYVGSARAFSLYSFYRPHPKDGEGYIFTLCVSPHLDGGEGVSGLRSR